jgi:hypothetical protein
MLPTLAAFSLHHILCYSSHFVAPRTQLITAYFTHNYFVRRAAPARMFMHTYISIHHILSVLFHD